MTSNLFRPEEGEATQAAEAEAEAAEAAAEKRASEKEPCRLLNITIKGAVVVVAL